MLALGLLLAGWGLLHLANAPVAVQSGQAIAPTASRQTAPCGFALKLSAAAEVVELLGPGRRLLFHQDGGGGPFVGMFELELVDPVVFIAVKWKDGAENGHFAKLTLEPAGKPTLTRFFEASGTINDVWELPGE